MSLGTSWDGIIEPGPCAHFHCASDPQLSFPFGTLTFVPQLGSHRVLWMLLCQFQLQQRSYQVSSEPSPVGVPLSEVLVRPSISGQEKVMVILGSCVLFTSCTQSLAKHAGCTLKAYL